MSQRGFLEEEALDWACKSGGRSKCVWGEGITAEFHGKALDSSPELSMCVWVGSRETETSSLAKVVHHRAGLGSGYELRTRLFKPQWQALSSQLAFPSPMISRGSPLLPKSFQGDRWHLAP